MSEITSVQIGPIRYTVRHVKRLRGAGDWQALMGEIDYSACVIKLEGKADPQAQRVTLIHEILHGVLLGGGERDHDERLIDLLSHGLLGVLRDNPALVAYLTEDH